MLEATVRRLRRAGIPDPRPDAEWLAAHVLDCGRAELMRRSGEPPTADFIGSLEPLVRRRCRREPLQYVLGVQEFYGHTVLVDPAVLVPRPETETLVDVALRLRLPERSRVLDLGTGSGCITLALALERPGWHFVGLDRSDAALELARRNAEAHGLGDRIELLAGDMADPPPALRDATFDLIVSNPPYVREEEWALLEPEVRDHEPRTALVGGVRGTEPYSTIVPVAGRQLRPGAWLVVEVGYGQSGEVAALFAARGFGAVSVNRDLRRIPRVVAGQSPGPDA